MHERSPLYWHDDPFRPAQLGADRFLRPADGGKEMNFLYLLTGLITLALFVYLVVALLKPEKFG